MNLDRDDDTAFEDEISKVWTRLHAVIASERRDFFDGSDSYDHASLAVLRLVAMMEPGSRFEDRFTNMGDDARRGLAKTRNILSHSGYGQLKLDVFWDTVTVSVPAELRRLGWSG